MTVGRSTCIRMHGSSLRVDDKARYRRVDQALTNPNPQDTLTWRAWPARERPLAAMLGGLIILAMAGVTMVSFGPWWGAAAIVFLVLALNRFYLPSRFAIDATGLVAQFPFRKQQLAWRAARRFLHDSHGGFLSTRSVASRIDAFSGLHILFGWQGKEIIFLIENHIGRAANEAAAARTSPPITLESRG